MNSVTVTNVKPYTSYYFGDTININDLYLDNILIDIKSYKNILVYDVECKTPYFAKPLSNIIDKVDAYIIKYDKTRYLALCHSNEKYKRIFDIIRFIIMLKCNISDVYSHKYAKIKINSNGDLPLEKVITMHNVKYYLLNLFLMKIIIIIAI